MPWHINQGGMPNLEHKRLTPTLQKHFKRCVSWPESHLYETTTLWQTVKKQQQQQKLVTVARPTIVPFSARTLVGRGPNSWRQKLARKKVFSSHSACMCVRAVAATEGHPARPSARQTVSGTIALNASLRRAGKVCAARGGFLPVTAPQRRGWAEWLLPFRLPRRF